MDPDNYREFHDRRAAAHDLDARRLSRAEEAFERSEARKEHARQRAMVEASIRSHARELKPPRHAA
jgi:hypothetical protein